MFVTDIKAGANGAAFVVFATGVKELGVATFSYITAFCQQRIRAKHCTTLKTQLIMMQALTERIENTFH
jgi:hypothetical protein